MSKSPPEWTEHRSDTQRTADDIAHQATLVRRDWPLVLDATAPSRKAGSGGSKSATITLDDDDPSTTDLDAQTKLMHLRRNGQEVLNAWCRLVMEERPITNPKSLPLGTDVEGMCKFIERQADWLSGTDHAPYALEELTELRWQVQAYTDPYKREWYRLGTCPHTPHGGPCGGTVRMRVGEVDAQPACSRCGCIGTVEAWHEEINGDEEIVSAAGLAKILSSRMGISVDERTIRRWANAGKVPTHKPFGPQPEKMRYLFKPSLAIDEVARMDRQCPMCGKLWSGRGEVCFACYGATVGVPRYTEREDGRWVKVVSAPPRRVVKQAPRVAQEDDICRMSDLPAAWCACGRHAM